MKLETLKVENHGRGITSVCNYKVLNNPKIMELLSNTLYSDKIAAIVRELGINALESHIKIGNTSQMPTLTLPSKDNPEFRLRDFGEGMSQEFLIKNYTSFGFSDKDQSNDFTGAFGLGSKSPFCYTSSFITTSYYNGTKYIFINNKYGDDGGPELKKICEEETVEPNGVEISFAVEPKDVDNFIITAAEILHYFPYKFDIEDETGQFKKCAENLKKEIVYQGNGWYIDNIRHDNTAIMGHVAYPIQREHFNRHYLLDCGIKINFKIGELGVNLGREELEYSNKTIQAIKDKLAKIDIELKDVLKKEIDKCPCLFDARVKYNKSSWDLQKLLANVHYNGEMLNGYHYSFDPYNAYLHYDRYGKHRKKKQHSIPYKNPDEKFVINDITRGSGVLVEDLVKEHKSIIVIKVPATEVDDLCKKIGIPKDRAILLSDIQKKQPQVKRSGGGGGFPTKTLEFVMTNNWKMDSYWNEVSVDLKNDKGYYITTTGNYIFENQKKALPDGLKRILCAIQNCGITVPRIIGLRPTHVKKIKDNKNWKNILEWIQEQYDKLAKQFPEEDLIKAIEYNSISTNSKEVLLKLIKKPEFKCEDIKKLFAIDVKSINKFKDVINVLRFNNLPKFNNLIDLDALEKKVNGVDLPKHYSIINHFNFGYYGMKEKDYPELIKIMNFLYEDAKANGLV